VRWQFGVPPRGNANFGWVQHFIHHLAPHGMAGFVPANASIPPTRQPVRRMCSPESTGKIAIEPNLKAAIGIKHRDAESAEGEDFRASGTGKGCAPAG